MSLDATTTLLPPAPSLNDLPEELLAIVARYLKIRDVCRLRATCRTLASHSVVLAGSCIPASLRFFRSATCAPVAVLSWATSGDARYHTPESETLGWVGREEGREDSETTHVEKRRKNTADTGAKATRRERKGNRQKEIRRYDEMEEEKQWGRRNDLKKKERRMSPAIP